MKKLTCAFFLILSLGSTVSAQISVRIKGGMSYISPKDYNEAIQGRNAYITETVAVPPMQGRLSHSRKTSVKDWVSHLFEISWVI